MGSFVQEHLIAIYTQLVASFQHIGKQFINRASGCLLDELGHYGALGKQRNADAKQKRLMRCQRYTLIIKTFRLKPKGGCYITVLMNLLSVVSPQLHSVVSKSFFHLLYQYFGWRIAAKKNNNFVLTSFALWCGNVFLSVHSASRMYKRLLTYFRYTRYNSLSFLFCCSQCHFPFAQSRAREKLNGLFHNATSALMGVMLRNVLWVHDCVDIVIVFLISDNKYVRQER